MTPSGPDSQSALYSPTGKGAKSHDLLIPSAWRVMTVAATAQNTGHVGGDSVPKIA
jgi:hypothetical protein